MFGYFRKGRSESNTFIDDKVKWFHFMEGFKDLVYEYVLYNVFKKYPDYRIEFDEYVESLKYFNELCECCSTHFNKRLDKTDITWIESVYNIIGTNSFAKSTNKYKKGKLFEILIILYITEGHKAINSFPDFIEKWFRDGILILITDLGDGVRDEMKRQFFDKKSEFSYTYKTKFHRFIFEIESETGKIGLSVFRSYYDYFNFNFNKKLDDDSVLDALKYSYDGKPIAKCQWKSRTKDGVEAISIPLCKEIKDNKNWSIVGTRLLNQGIKVELNLDDLCKYEEERNTKRLIRKVTGMSNKKYKEFLNDIKRKVYKSDLQSEILIAKLSKATDLPVDNYTVSIAMGWLNIGRGWNISHIKVTDLLDAIIEIKEEDN